MRDAITPAQDWQQLYLQHSWVYERLGVIPRAVASASMELALAPPSEGAEQSLSCTGKSLRTSSRK